MNNPFLNHTDNGSDYVTSVCSINKMRLAKLPVYGVDDIIEGLTVKEFFRNKLIIDAVKENADRLHINLDEVREKKLPIALAKKSQDENDKSGAELARVIMERFGSRLGLLLLALKLGEEPNRKARPDWTDAHWDYWANVEDIILVGGLASGTFGETLKNRVNAVFALAGVKPYNILLYANASQVAVLGCASCIRESDGVYIVMDFGQTGIKRSYVVKKGGEIADIGELEPYPSKYMDWEMPSEEEKLKQAQALHAYLLSAVESTYLEAKRATKTEPSGTLIASIASYSVNGAVNRERGGYAKLSALGANYAEILSWDLSGRLRRDVKVTLIHDGTAVALNFRDKKNTVCLSVGSYFGVGFPETKLV